MTMQTFYGHFTRYKPANSSYSALYFLSDDGIDWFTFTRSICQWSTSGELLSTATGETFVAVEPTTRKILSVQRDLSALVPDGMDVYGLDPETVDEEDVGKFLVDGEVTDVDPNPAPLPLVPVSVSTRQARMALLRAGLLANVVTIIASMEGEAGDEARIEWEYATELRRDHFLIKALGAALNLSEDQIDDLFRTAAAIV